jgi:hypothetical protein
MIRGQGPGQQAPAEGQDDPWPRRRRPQRGTAYGDCRFDAVSAANLGVEVGINPESHPWADAPAGCPAAP